MRLVFLAAALFSGYEYGKTREDGWLLATGLFAGGALL